MMKKLLFIYNPNAGRGNVRRYVSRIVEHLSAAGYLIAIFPTAKHGDAVRWARHYAKKYDFVVASGGDGTLNEVVNGMMQARENGDQIPPLGYIPEGTVNDFATSRAIPKDVTEALQVVTNGNDVPTDIGSYTAEGTVNYFTYIAAFGIFTSASYETPQDAKNVLGKTAYVLEAIRSLQVIHPYRVTVRHDDVEFTDDFIYGMVTNSTSVGGFQGLTGPEVHLDDGQFDVILVRNPRNAADLQEIINAFLQQSYQSDSVYHFHSGEITFLSEDEIPWTLDGEAGGAHKEVIVHNHQKALSVRVPGTAGDVIPAVE